MRLVRTYGHWQHDSSFAKGEPLPLHYTLRQVLMEMNHGAQHRVAGAVVRRTAEALLVSVRENGQPVHVYLNVLHESPEEELALKILGEYRGRTDAKILLNLAAYQELDKEGAL